MRLNPICGVNHNPKLKIACLDQVLEDTDTVLKLAEEINSLPFDHVETDLFSMSVTKDLSTVTESLPAISSFKTLLTTGIKEKLEIIFQAKTSPQISVSASAYLKGDHLLCHDDLCGDRYIAFVYYLTKEWTEQDGGQLRFFDIDKDSNPVPGQYRATVEPRFNTLVAFEVHETSYHEVQEVLAEDKCRLAISGWFHLEGKDGSQMKQAKIDRASPFFKQYPMSFNSIKKCKEDMSGKQGETIVRPSYLYAETVESLNKFFKKRKFVLASNFLSDKFYGSVAEELRSSDLDWRREGPADRRNYHVLNYYTDGEDEFLQVDNLPHNSKLNRLLNFMVSDYWLNYLGNITQCEFAVFESAACPPTCMIEIQNWKDGSYSLLADNNFHETSPNIEVIMFFNVDSDYFQHSKKNRSWTKNDKSSLIYSLYNRHIILTRKVEVAKQIEAKLYRIKWKRILREANPVKLIKADKKFNRWIDARLKKKVIEKMKKLKVYREQNICRPPSEPKFEHQQFWSEAPENNFMLIVNRDTEEGLGMIQQYLKHIDGVAATRYHSVTINYMTAGKIQA